MSRDQFIATAISKLGEYGKGSPEVVAIWRDVLSPSMSDEQVRLFAKTNEWCGGFVLNCLRDAGLTTAHWKIGSGFVLSLLGAASRTRTPKPGDIGIRVGEKGHEVYHHFIVERWNTPNDWDSIDGNSPHAARHHHDKLDATISFYSIDALLAAEAALPEAGFPRDSIYSVPGIQDPKD